MSIFGGIDPAMLLTREQAVEVARHHPGLLRLLTGNRAMPSSPRLMPSSLPSRSAPEPIEQRELVRSDVEPRRRRLPVFDYSVGRRDCRTCPSPCCTILAASLTPSEVASGRYEKEGPGQDGQYYMPRPLGRCVYLTAENDCSIYEDRPEVCRRYRCDNPGAEDDRVNRWFLHQLTSEATT